jgi:hypothetical protein
MVSSGANPFQEEATARPFAVESSVPGTGKPLTFTISSSGAKRFQEKATSRPFDVASSVRTTRKPPTFTISSSGAKRFYIAASAPRRSRVRRTP